MGRIDPLVRFIFCGVGMDTKALVEKVAQEGLIVAKMDDDGEVIGYSENPLLAELRDRLDSSVAATVGKTEIDDQ